MEDYIKQIEILKSDLALCQHENEILKELLQEAGIEYEGKLRKNIGVLESYDPDQGRRIKPFQITEDTANYFFQKFWGRQDVYSLRTTNLKTGKVGYYTQCYNFWQRRCHRKIKDGIQCKDCKFKAYIPLTKNTVIAHLKGKNPYANDVVAVYPMLENNTCRFLVFDFDDHQKGAAQDDFENKDESWKEEVNALRQICGLLHIDALVERSRSGKGAHVWIFFKQAIPAKTARQFGFALLDKGAESVNLKTFRYYDRMIPAQDVLLEGGMGNAVALPLQGLALKAGNSAFVDENWNAYPEQLNVLWNTKALPLRQVEECIKLWKKDNPFTEEIDDDGKRVKPWVRKNDFLSADVRGKVIIVNLLSKEDAEDNLMRVVSKDIAAELLEMTFGRKMKMEKW